VGGNKSVVKKADVVSSTAQLEGGVEVIELIRSLRGQRHNIGGKGHGRNA